MKRLYIKLQSCYSILRSRKHFVICIQDGGEGLVLSGNMLQEEFDSILVNHNRKVEQILNSNK